VVLKVHVHLTTFAPYFQIDIVKSYTNHRFLTLFLRSFVNAYARKHTHAPSSQIRVYSLFNRLILTSCDNNYPREYFS